LIESHNPLLGLAASAEPRQVTSNIGFLKKPTIQARIHGLDRHYYSLVIDWRKNDLEEQMLMNLHKKDWSTGINYISFI
jgi:26S proteasome regulatory subunit N11